jgi:hypothetical protein
MRSRKEGRTGHTAGDSDSSKTVCRVRLCPEMSNPSSMQSIASNSLTERFQATWGG